MTDLPTHRLDGRKVDKEIDMKKITEPNKRLATQSHDICGIRTPEYLVYLQLIDTIKYVHSLIVKAHLSVTHLLTQKPGDTTSTRVSENIYKAYSNSR